MSSENDRQSLLNGVSNIEDDVRAVDDNRGKIKASRDTHI